MIRIIAFDGEFADKEILELSIFSLSVDESESAEEVAARDPEETFHQYFKPRTEKFWPGSQRVHHISPKMVSHRPFITRFQDMIEREISEADFIIGFDIQNDISHLEYEGLEVGNQERIVDVKDFYWLLHGRNDDVPLDSRKGLEVTAQELGMEFEERKAHGASYDTFVTMKCFLHLIAEYAKTHPGLPLPALLDLYRKEWFKAFDDYRREQAKGYLSLIPAVNGYRLKISGNPSPKAEISIPVNSRRRALNEVDAKFSKRISRTDGLLYCLKASDKEWLKSYSNEFESYEAEQQQESLYHLRHTKI